MRVTSNMIMRNYTSRLNNLLSDMSIANEKVVSNRKFLTAAEAPADAAQAYLLRRQMQNNSDYLENVKSMKDVETCMESSMMDIKSIASQANDAILQSGGTLQKSDREILATQLDELQQSMVASANSQFQGRFLFGGSSVDDVPFKLENGVLTFRGVDVNAKPGTKDYEKLQAMASETIYSDLGLGMNVDLGSAGGTAADKRIITPGSAYNSAMPGIKFLGFGQNEKGDSNNLILSLGEIATALRADHYDADRVTQLGKKLEGQTNSLLANITQMGSNSNFLDTTQKRLENNAFNLTKKINNVEYDDPAAQILDFKQLDYAYKAALQMGMNILSPSFIDFMR